MLYYKCTTNGGNMKVQKFNSKALVKVLNQYKESHLENLRIRADIISARDAWIQDIDSDNEEYDGEQIEIKIIEKDDEVIIETDSLTFRISGNFVTKEESI
jgi:hypothetical protein